MDAQVIAMGRNEEELARLKAHVTSGTPGPSIETVKITGDEDKDATALQAFGIIDTVLDLTLRRKGRISLMGGFMEGPIPSFQLVAKDIIIKGKFMYEREDMQQFVKMLEGGLLDLKIFPLDDWKTALGLAAEYIRIGRFVAIKP